MQEIPSAPGPLPEITYPEDLPVAARREEIARAIARHPVVVVAGETGSGKTTQIPKICLELGRGVAGLIGHTQPRRLAARTVAARIAAELGGATGDLVGYQVRFGERLSPATRVKLMTDGILLNEMQHDRRLARYDTLIIDEAHERSLNIDFLLGYLKRLLPRRPDLKVIVTSATIDVQAFSRHFDDAPVIEVAGRSWPVQTHYLGSGEDDGEGGGQRIAGLLEEIAGGGYGPRGDALVFLPGEREIRELARSLRGLQGIDVLPLYARLSQAEQNRVFDPAGRRAGMRAVLATNVAETSLTVPGIRYVIDTGTARISRYSHRSRLQRLPVEPISRASADQRRGRCGRIGPGVCLRLYDEADYAARPEFTDPEIRRTNLAAVVLQMLSLGLGAVERFPFIDPPDGRMVRDGYRLLEELGAVTAQGELTRTGRRLSRLPVDPRLARMIVEAVRRDSLAEILVIASALSVQDPRERPAEKRAQADQMHARFKHPRSDFLAWLNLWRYYEEQRQALSQNQLRRLCQREFLSFPRMREWRDVHTQLSIACRGQKLRVPRDLPDEENYRGVHQALLSGLLSNLLHLVEKREYQGAGERRALVFPGSAQARRAHKWLVAAEIVETSRVYAREVAAVEPRWVIELDPPMLRRHHYEPHWHARSGRVMARERISLFGLTLSDRGRVHYGPLNPAEGRELMIREGLVPGDVRPLPDFLRHNLALVAELEALEARTRRGDLLVPEETRYTFYDERLPADIFNARRLQSWLKREPGAEAALYMERDFLLARDPGSEVQAQFPAELAWRDLRFPLSYTFEPGGAADGVSVTLPLGLLNRAPRFLFDWLVPGLLREKCIALVRGLPKEQRKHLVPVPDTVERVLADLEADDVDLLEALARSLTRLGGVRLSRDDFSPDKLDDYYRMNVRVVDARGKLLAQGRDLPALIERFREDTRESLAGSGENSPAREGLTGWDFDALPRQWRSRQAGVDIVAWPALADRGDSVAIELCDYESEAWLSHRLGVLRLLRLSSAQPVRYLRKQVLRDNEASLALAGAELEREPLVEDLIDAACLQAALAGEELPRSREAFARSRERTQQGMVARATDLEQDLRATVLARAELSRLLASLPAAGLERSLADIHRQLGELFTPHFQRDTPGEWLAQYPRYLRALCIRAERLRGQAARDEQHAATLEAAAQPLRESLVRRPALLLLCPEAMLYRWLLEEFRVSLFAQNLGTRRPVSAKRLAEHWRDVERWLAEHPP